MAVKQLVYCFFLWKKLYQKKGKAVSNVHADFRVGYLRCWSLSPGILNAKVLGMLGENQIIKKRLILGRYTLTIRDDVEYGTFTGTEVRFSINSGQIEYLIVNFEKKAFDSRYRIVVKKVKRD